MEKSFLVNGKEYHVLKLLGYGKSGYSYLAEYEENLVVLKKIHHEPCSYYTFGDKLDAEKYNYGRILNTNIRMPKMYEIDFENEIIIKEYIDGPTIYDLVLNDEMQDVYLEQVREMADLAKKHNLNIDYFPTNYCLRK
ncbi:hypothetical protein SAMN02910289_00263 [Lachnospiraceae bacterium RM5]|nr:hypothetical protein SAMN02910289_00263 [Lachnospiraceae bacterium RM5]